MGLFAPFIYTNKQGKKFWLHSKQRGKAILYYFSQNPEMALYNLPPGYEVVENPLTGLPFLRKKTSRGFLSGIFKFGGKKEEKAETQEKS